MAYEHSSEMANFEIRVGTYDNDSFYVGIKPPLEDDSQLRHEVYEFIDSIQLKRSVGMFVDPGQEDGFYTDILFPFCGAEAKDVAMLGIARVIVNNGHTITLNTKPQIYINTRHNLFA